MSGHFWDESPGAVRGLGRLDSGDLLHLDFVQYHPRYPPLTPLAEQHVYALLGRADDRWSKLVFPQLYLGLALTPCECCSGICGLRRLGCDAGVGGAVLMLAFNDYGFLSARADAPGRLFSRREFAAFVGLAAFRSSFNGRFIGGAWCWGRLPLR